MKSIGAGDLVRVLVIPEWLLRDLPETDQEHLKAQQGLVVQVLKAFPNGYLWLAFADGTEGFSLQPSEVELA